MKVWLNKSKSKSSDQPHHKSPKLGYQKLFKRSSVSATDSYTSSELSLHSTSSPRKLLPRSWSTPTLASPTSHSHDTFIQKLVNESSLLANHGPKVKPFAYSQTQPKVKVSRTERICFVCEESITVTFSNEKNVLLQCGDCVHGECFETLLAAILHRDGHSLPPCKGHNCSSNDDPSERQRPMAPVDLSLVSTIMVSKRQSVTKKAFRASSDRFSPPSPALEGHQKSFQRISSSSSSVYSDATNSISEQEIEPTFPLRVASSIASRTNEDRNSRYSSRTVSINHREHSPTPTVSSQQTVSVRVKMNKDTPREALSNRFIKYLIEHNKQFSISSLLQCGDLRLVDTFFSTSNELEQNKPSQFTLCYLFQYSVVVWDKDSGSTIMLPLSNVKFKVLSSSSVLKIESFDISAPRHENKVWLSANNPSILEKWVIALSDSNFEFPSDLITSTLTSVDQETSDLLSPIRTSFPFSLRNSMYESKFKPLDEVIEEVTPTEPIDPQISQHERDEFQEDVTRLGLFNQGPSIRPVLENSSSELDKFNEVDTDTDIDSDQEAIELCTRDFINSLTLRSQRSPSQITSSKFHESGSDLALGKGAFQTDYESDSESYVSEEDDICKVPSHEALIVDTSPRSISTRFSERTIVIPSSSAELSSESASDKGIDSDSESESDSDSDSDQEMIDLQKQVKSADKPSGWSDLMGRIDVVIVDYLK